MKRNCTHVKLEEKAGEREEPVLQAMPGSQSHLNPLPAVQLSEHTGVLGVHSQAARLGTLPMHLQVRRGRHRLQRLVYRDPQEMLSPHSPPRES